MKEIIELAVGSGSESAGICNKIVAYMQSWLGHPGESYSSIAGETEKLNLAAASRSYLMLDDAEYEIIYATLGLLRQLQWYGKELDKRRLP